MNNQEKAEENLILPLHKGNNDMQMRQIPPPRKHFLRKIYNTKRMVVLVASVSTVLLLLSGAYQFHGRGTSSSPMQPREHSDIPEVCAEVFSDTATSLCTLPVESQLLCNIPLETCRHQTRPIQNMTPHIVTALYRGHFDLYLDFLNSAIEFVVDLEAIKWTVVVSDVSERQDIMALFQKQIKSSTKLNINWWTLEEALLLHEGTGCNMTEIQEAHSKKRKYAYISLKKIYGLLAADFDYALVADADSLFRRPTNMTMMFLEWFDAPWYWHEKRPSNNGFLNGISDAQFLLLNSTMQEIDRNVGHEHLYIWETANWFFEKNAFASFIGRIQTLHGTVHKGILHGTTDMIFADGAYFLYLLINRTLAAPHYRFMRIEQELRRYNFTEDEMKVFHDAQKKAGNGMFEHFEWATYTMVDKLVRIMNDYKEATFRYWRKSTEIDCVMREIFDKAPTLRLQACSTDTLPDNCPNMTTVA